jgi:hypothetical protein
MGRHSFTRKEKASPDLSLSRLLLLVFETEKVYEDFHELTEVVVSVLQGAMFLPGVVEKLEHPPTDVIHDYFGSESSNRMSAARSS